MDGNKAPLAALLSGLIVFLYQLGEILAKHSLWAEFRTPAGVGEICVASAAALVAFGGALFTDFSKLIDALRRK